MKVKSTLLILALLLCGFQILQAQTTYYVEPNATGGGTSWSDAGDFQTIIGAAAAGDSVFVAQGTYQPGSGSSFSMKEGVKIYGGFAGTETYAYQRNRETNITTLKGNGNSVVNNNSNSLSAAAVLDGFTITGGQTSYAGGGMYNSSSSPTITNCVFSGNSTEDFIGFGGGGMYNNSSSSPTITNCVFSNNSVGILGFGGGGMLNQTSSSPTITNCVFSGNSVGTDGEGGGAIANLSSSPTITNCVFSGNSAGTDGEGGGIYNNGASPNITNCTFYNNTDGGAGGGIICSGSGSSNTHITNCIIYDNTSPGANAGGEMLTINYSLVQDDDGTEGTGDIDGSEGPMFTNPGSGDFSLQSGSPAIDAGTPDTTGFNIPALDLLGNPRITGSAIDMGAIEYQGAALPVTIISFNGALQNSIVQLQWRTTNEINLSHFEVERSSDGIHYSLLTTVAATGNGTVNNYAAIDASPLPGTDYYRLKSVDNNGSFAYSTIVTVNINSNSSVPLIVYPKPATNQLTVKYAAAASDAVLTIYSLNGQELSTTSLNGSTQATIDVSNLSAGEYIIKYQSSTVTLTDKFTKVDY